MHGSRNINTQVIWVIKWCSEENLDWGAFNNYVNKIRGGGGQKMTKFCPRSCWMTTCLTNIHSRFFFMRVRIIKDKKENWLLQYTLFQNYCLIENKLLYNYILEIFFYENKTKRSFSLRSRPAQKLHNKWHISQQLNDKYSVKECIQEKPCLCHHQ